MEKSGSLEGVAPEERKSLVEVRVSMECCKSAVLIHKFEFRKNLFVLKKN